MKINDVNRLNALHKYREYQTSVPGARGKKGAAKDEVHISAEAKELLGAEMQRTERIDQLKRAVQSGTYHVDSMKIAEKMLPYFRPHTGQDR